MYLDLYRAKLTCKLPRKLKKRLKRQMLRRMKYPWKGKEIRIKRFEPYKWYFSEDVISFGNKAVTASHLIPR